MAVAKTTISIDTAVLKNPHKPKTERCPYVKSNILKCN
jgi:hypothetical protein